MNPCSHCGTEPQLEVDAESTAFLTCPCGKRDLYIFWNEHNPLPGPDPLATALEQLDELYCFLEEIKHMDLISIRLWANDLLSKHREANNASH